MMNARIDARVQASGLAAIATLGIAAISWLVVWQQVQQMGVVETGLESFQSFIGSWLAMMMAMMLPSSIPFVSRVAASTRAQPQFPPST
jgi:predicted metal-binding membrane protein